MDHQTNYEEEIELRELVQILLRKWKLIVAITLAGALLALLFSLAQSFQKPPITYHQATAQVQLVPSRFKPQQVPAFVDIARGKTAAERTIAKLELENSPEELIQQITVKTVEDTNNIQISVLNQESSKASIIAESMRVEAILLASEAMDVRSLTPLGEVSLVEDFLTETAPINHTLNTAIGLVLGLMFSVFFVFAQKYFNNKVQTIEEVEKILGVKVLASIPRCEKTSDSI